MTWRLQPFQYELYPEERTMIENAISHFDGERYELLAYVVMHDHVHIIVEPAENFKLQQLVHSWKSYTSNRLQRQFNRMKSIWQDEYFDRILRDETELLEKAQYIFNNPFKVWPDMEEYQWLGGKLMEMAGAEAPPPYKIYINQSKNKVRVCHPSFCYREFKYFDTYDKFGGPGAYTTMAQVALHKKDLLA